MDGRIAGRCVVDRSAQVGKDLAIGLAGAVATGARTGQAVERVGGCIQLLGGQLRLKETLTVSTCVLPESADFGSFSSFGSL